MPYACVTYKSDCPQITLAQAHSSTLVCANDFVVTKSRGQKCRVHVSNPILLQRVKLVWQTALEGFGWPAKSILSPNMACLICCCCIAGCALAFECRGWHVDAHDEAAQTSHTAAVCAGGGCAPGKAQGIKECCAMVC